MILNVKIEILYHFTGFVKTYFIVRAAATISVKMRKKTMMQVLVTATGLEPTITYFVNEHTVEWNEHKNY